MELMKLPRSVDIEITSRCNLRCTYCSHFSSAGDVSKDLSLEEWLRFFEELNQCSVMSVCLSGGEAFFRNDIKEIIEGIVRNRMRFSILSNGTLITDEIAAFLASTRRCNSVQVSIDGSQPISHDSFRGKGTFYKAVEGIGHLQRNKVPVTVRVTIHRQNVKDLGNITRFLLEEIGLPSFSTNAASYMGLCRKNEEQIQLTIEERSLAMETLLRLSQKYPGRITASAGPLAEARHWLDIEQARKENREAMVGRGHLTGCGCSWSKLAVRADGIMVPCSQLPSVELGRINRDSLLDAWRNNPYMEQLRNRRNIPLIRFDSCRECDYTNYCTGSCPALAYNLYGETERPSPDACLKLFLASGGRLPSEETCPC